MYFSTCFEADVLTHNLARGGGVGLSKDFAESFLCKDRFAYCKQ